MSLSEIEAATPHRMTSQLRRFIAGAAVALVAVAGFSAADAVPAQAAGESVSIDRTVFRHGDYLAVKVGNLEADWDYVLELRNPAGQAKAVTVFGTDANGLPENGDTHQRLSVTSSVPVGAGYRVVLIDDVTFTETIAAETVEIKGPFIDSSVLGAPVFNAANNTVTVSGTGFTNKDETGASKIGVKLNNGAQSHPLASNPVPTPWPVGGASPEGVWYYIGSGTLPNPAYGTNSITASGDFTVTIPVPASLGSGNHTLRFLTGSLTAEDPGRAKVITFTK